jgi:hypothetical protein
VGQIPVNFDWGPSHSTDACYVNKIHHSHAIPVCINWFGRTFNDRVQMLEAMALQRSPYRCAVYFTLLFAAEALVFYVQMADQIAPFFPKNFDQTGYINYTYQLFEAIRDRGWVSILSEIANPPTAVGTALIVQGAVIAFFGGPNRTALASLNLIYFIILQLVIFQTIRIRTRSIHLALIAIALLLSMPTIFNPAGGIFDFRMDFAAFCLYGIWTCLIVWSRCLAQTRMTVILTSVAILLIATRSFTVIYIGSVLFGLLIYSIVDIRREANRASGGRAVHRARNILWSGAFVAIATLPLLIAARQKLYERYVVGHFLNEEKYIRAEEMNVHSIADHILFYPKSILADHIGQPALWLALAIVTLTIVRAPWARGGQPQQIAKRLYHYLSEFVALGVATIIPIALLTVDIAKSTVVGGIVTVPILLATILAIEAIWPWLSEEPATRFSAPPGAKLPDQSRPVSRTIKVSFPVMACVGIFIFSFSAFLTHASVRQHEMPRSDLEEVRSINELIASAAINNGSRELTMSIDRVVDYLNIGTVALAAYEHFRQRLNFRRGMLGDGIFATSREDALRLVEDSDFFVLTDPARGRESPYPMNVEIQKYWNDLRLWALQNMVILGGREISGISHQVFAKPPVSITGISGDWITSAGITITADSNHMRRWPFVVLEGEAPYDVLGGEPHPRAVTFDDDAERPGADLPIALKRIGSRYQITIDTRTAALSSTSPTRIRLTFDRSFVPDKLGINRDTRELVVLAPIRAELRAAAP